MAAKSLRGKTDMTGERLAALKAEGGFTLVELMVVVIIMGVFLTGVMLMIVNGINSSASSYDLIRIDEDGNEAISVMTRQLRVAGTLDPNSTASIVTFAGDVNGDGTADTVRFEVSDGYLKRGSGEGMMDEWIANVDQLTLRYYYYNEDTRQEVELTPGTANWDNNYRSIRHIDIELVLSKQSTESIVTGRTFQGSVFLRNALE